MARVALSIFQAPRSLGNRGRRHGSIPCSFRALPPHFHFSHTSPLRSPRPAPVLTACACARSHLSLPCRSRRLCRGGRERAGGCCPSASSVLFGMGVCVAGDGGDAGDPGGCDVAPSVTSFPRLWGAGKRAQDSRRVGRCGPKPEPLSGGLWRLCSSAAGSER